jgi:secreted trypsin-like serine protease
VSSSNESTAAHCVFPKTSRQPRKLLPRNVIALFGAFNLSKIYETNRIALSPSEIIVHDDWNPETMRYDGDIAMLLFDEEVCLTRFIKPICLWELSSEMPADEGTVTGWGMSEDVSKQHESIPKQLQVPIHSNEHCFLTNSFLALISSPRTFCAGSGNGSSVCLGDSGHGLFIKHENINYLKGIVSSSVSNNDRMCDVNTFSVFTNVEKFKNWIQNVFDREISTLSKVSKLSYLQYF